MLFINLMLKPGDYFCAFLPLSYYIATVLNKIYRPNLYSPSLMKLIAGCLLTVFFTIAYLAAWAQTSSTAIHGKVTIEQAAPAEAATIMLLNARDSSVVKGTISGKTGLFSFSGLQAGNYLVFVTLLNYNKNYAGPFQVSAGTDLDAGLIMLSRSPKNLAEIVVTGKKDYVEVRPDKKILNVDQNVMAAGASLYDVLGTSPGVRVNDDEILYRGGQKALIAIDGKPLQLSGDELVNYLKSLQSSSISKIELIDNPGGKYEASAAGGMINIILKKNSNIGSNASVSQTAAVGDKYKLSTSVNYNLRTEKLNLYVSYGFQDNKVPHTISNDRTIGQGGQLYDFGLNYLAMVTTLGNNFSIGADYKLGKGQTIGFLINGFDNNITFNKQNNTSISTNGQLDSSINSHSNIKRDINNFSYNLNYTGKLDKDGNSVLTFNGDYTDYNRSSAEVLENDFFNAAGLQDSAPIDYMDRSPSRITIQSARLDFSQKLSKETTFSLGIKSSKVRSDNQINFEQLIGGNYQNVDALTDHFIYNERIDAAYMQMETKFDKTSLFLGLRGERTSNSAFSVNPSRLADSSYLNFFPTIQLSQELSKNNELTVFYRRNINRPNYQDLNPFVGYVDQFYYSTGNPFLKPDYINTYSISDLLFNTYRIDLSYIKTDNYFNTIFEQNDVSKVYINTKANLATRFQYELSFSVPLDVTPWWNVSADVGVYHEKFAYLNDTIPPKQTNAADIYLSQTFKISPRLSLQLLNNYESATFYNISQYKKLYDMDAGFSYSLFKNKGSLKLVVSDIFNTNYNLYHTSYANLNITEKDKVGSRFISATFTYRFGKTSARKRNTTLDEQKRLGGAGNDN